MYCSALQKLPYIPDEDDNALTIRDKNKPLNYVLKISSSYPENHDFVITYGNQQSFGMRINNLSDFTLPEIYTEYDNFTIELNYGNDYADPLKYQM